MKERITDKELNAWMRAQLRAYEAGLLEPWQVKALRKAGAIKEDPRVKTAKKTHYLNPYKENPDQDFFTTEAVRP